MRIKTLIVGLLYGFCASLVIGFLIAIFGNSIAGGAGSDGWLWFFLTLCVPLSLSFAISGFQFHRIQFKGTKFILLCMIIALINVLIMGTAGAIIVSGETRGYETVNIEGYLQWGPIYAVLFLPLSTPLVAGLLLGFRKSLNVINVE